MTSVLILTVTTLILLPALIKIYDERDALQDEQTALYLLDQVISNWIYEEGDEFEISVQEENKTFIFDNSIDGDLFTVCISWLGANGRNYERCESAKR